MNFINTSPTGTLGQVLPVTLRRTGGLGTIMTVNWQVVGGTADGESESFPSSGSVVFLADQSTQTFFVNITSNPSAIGKTIVLGFTVPVPNAIVGAELVSGAGVPDRHDRARHARRHVTA